MQHYDVVISGAGLAGCSAALTLARYGLSVALLDKARFPREKVCGDGCTAASSRILDELGVLDMVRQRLGALRPFNGVKLFSPGGAVVEGRFTGTGSMSGQSWVIPRAVLDDCLSVRVGAACVYWGIPKAVAALMECRSLYSFFLLTTSPTQTRTLPQPVLSVLR